MGIGGAGMSALALTAHRRGILVTGCDTDLSGAADLLALGITVHAGHDPEHVAGARAVIVTAAVKPDHPELLAARRNGIPVFARKAALGALVNGRTVVACAGTHGKTTTTVMATEALRAAGFAPTGLAGGRVGSWGANAWLDSDDVFVVEADEYDKAFLTLAPTVAIVNNVEADHLECYGGVPQLEAAFAEFAGRAKTILIGADDVGAARVAAGLTGQVWRFGLDAASDICLSEIHHDATGSSAVIHLPDGRRETLRLQVPGLHNLRNAAGALGAVVALEGPIEPALKALADFSGVGRRFDRLGDTAGVSIVDDYAHHPSELAATLAAARQAYPGRRLVAVFQPHLYSRTQQHGQSLGAALAAADLAIVTDVYAARETPVDGVTGALVARAASDAGATVIYDPVRDGLAKRVAPHLRKGDLVMTLGAGDVTRIGPELLELLAP